jgi:inner membrane protein
MDNLTHSLFALTLARTSIGRAGRGTTTALLLASNAPDIDFVATASGTASYLHWHRGPTHGPLGIVGLGLIVGGLVYSAGRVSKRSVASFSALAATGVLGVLLHVLMDLPTSYGTRLLSPFSWHWFAVDWMPIIDVYLWILLVAGLVLGSLRARARQRIAVAVLVLMGADYGIRAIAHQRALGAAPRLFASASQEVAAIPTFFSPFSWRVISKQADRYELADVNVLWPESGTISAQYPNVWTDAVFHAARSPVAQIFLGFSRFPAVRTLPAPDGHTVVQWNDMRFVTDNGNSRNGLFTATVWIDREGRVLDETLGE